MIELARLFWQLLNSGFLDESVARVRVEYDDNRVEIRAATFDGARVRRIKLKNERVRDVYYYDAVRDIVRKDEFDSNGILERAEQRRGGDRQGAQVQRRKDGWRVRAGEDRDDEQIVDVEDEFGNDNLLALEVLVGPPLGRHDDTTSLLAQFARELAALDRKLVERERRVEFRYDAELQSISVEIDRRRTSTFRRADL